MSDHGELERYRDGVGLPPSDGRNVDPDLGALAGEGAQQQVSTVLAHPTPHAVTKVPADAVAGAEEGPSYYGAPLLKEPVWKWYVPAYFYVGGVAGAAAALGGAAQLATGRGSPGRLRRHLPAPEHKLVGRCRIIATGGAAASAALLIADLGRPERFLNMLRVFRPSSPMNMGTWFLSAFGGCCAASALPHLLPSSAWQRRVSDAAALGAGLMGLPLCTYTGVLIANTAVPIWQGTRRTLPVLFAASGAAGAASLLELWPPGGEGDRVAHRFGVMGKVLELGLTLAFEREAAEVPRVARPLRRGVSAAMWRTSQALTLGGLAGSLLSRRRSLRRVAGLLGTLGAVMLRFAVLQAGRASARDPQASFAQQRAGRGAADVVKKQQSDRGTPALEKVGFDVGTGMEQAGGREA
jgi:formate-dependent nitrite reductase membrane component NrfD